MKTKKGFNRGLAASMVLVASMAVAAPSYACIDWLLGWMYAPIDSNGASIATMRDVRGYAAPTYMEARPVIMTPKVHHRMHHKHHKMHHKMHRNMEDTTTTTTTTTTTEQ